MPLVDTAVVVMMLSSKRPAPRERESRAGRRRNLSHNCEPLLQLAGLFERHQESRPRRMDSAQPVGFRLGRGYFQPNADR